MSAADDDPLAIVGIGGSAGSLAPLRELISGLPVDSGMAFVVVSHQAPTGHSLLPEILAKATSIPVQEIEPDTRALPNHVYVAPRGYRVTLHEGVLSLEPLDDTGRVPLPIDFVFRALALDRGHCAVGIVLSGTGSDGALGLAAIHSESGLCLAQDPATAEFDGMPTSAIVAKATDYVLPVSEMPERLVSYARSLRNPSTGRKPSGVSDAEMERILTLIRVRGGHDFSLYKRDTLMRRIERRMDLHRIERCEAYVDFLEKDDVEINALWRDWLIGVSAFFRDPEAFEALVETGLPPLLSARTGESQLRVWIPGCATGEEAYSVAIAILETLEARGEHLDVQIFGTDLDSVAIETARAGRYPKAVAAAIGAQRLKRFFIEEEQTYRATKELRDRIVFAVQDVLHDPPFTRVDLISCRNLLIYVVPSAQQGMLSLFHYSLNPGGLLLLGASEHVGGSSELFSMLDKRWKLFQRNDSVTARPPFRWAPRAALAAGPGALPALTDGAELDLTETLRTCLAERFAPPSVVVDLQGRIQQTHGRVGPFLELPPGRVNLNVVDMARDGLRAPLSTALRAVAKDGAGVVEKDVRAKTDDGWQELRLTVARIEGRRMSAPMLLVSFETKEDRRASGGTRAATKAARPKRAKLEEELDHLRQELRVSVGDLQSANEELASANEEAQSANEELQSTNEELQTSKEETQSLNEELQTVNAELTEKLKGLEQANDDLLNLMSNLEIATIFLDDRLRVKRFTPQARSVARLIDTDIGRPLADLATPVDYPDLLSDAGSVLASLRPIERQASAPGGVWYTVRIRPYRTRRNAVEGLVVTFIDITETIQRERGETARVLAEGIVDAVHEPLLVLDPELHVVRANRSYYRAFREEPEQAEGKPIDALSAGLWSDPELRALLTATLRNGDPFEGAEFVREVPDVGRRRLVLSGRPVSVQGESGQALIVLGIHDAGAEDGGA